MPQVGGRALRLRLSSLCVLLASVLLVAACSSGDESQPEASDTVRIGTFSSAVDYAPFYVARSRELFESAAGDGKKVEYVEFDSAPAITEALATKRVDLVFMAEPPALIASAAGIRVNIAALGVLGHDVGSGRVGLM